MSQLLYKMLLVFAATGSIGYALWAIRCGQVIGRRYDYDRTWFGFFRFDRTEHPLTFWCTVLCYLMAGGAFLYAISMM